MNDSDHLRRRPSAVQLLLAAAMLGIFLALYMVAARVGGNPPTTKAPIDDRWRLVPLLVWLYISPYLVGIVVVGLLPRPVFRAFMARGLVIGAAHTAFNFLVPTRVDRPPLPESLEGPSASMLRLVYAIDDPPLNAAPSAHVSVTLLLTWAAWHGLPGLRAPFCLWGAAVVASVLFTRQHHLVDVVTGLILVGLVLGGFWIGEGRRHPHEAR